MCSTGLIAPESHFYLKIGALVAEIHLLEVETIDEIFKISTRNFTTTKMSTLESG